MIIFISTYYYIDVQQKPPRATPEEMTRFHTDEYIDFLQNVTPETAADLTRNHEICKLFVMYLYKH